MKSYRDGVGSCGETDTGKQPQRDTQDETAETSAAEGLNVR